MIYVLYHSSCMDGFGAAYAAWKKFGPDAVYIPVSYGYPPPKMEKATEIYILDFSFKKEVLLEMSAKAKVVMLDHHKTAKEDLEMTHVKPGAEGLVAWLEARSNLKIIFDMNKSGALIAWEYFHPATEVPALIQHISDRDLWQFKLPGSEIIHKALVSYPMDFETWDKFDIARLREEGKICERLYTQLVNNTIRNAFFQKIDGHNIPVVNTSIAWSEVGHALLERYPDAPFVASFTVLPDTVMWSLRSRPNFDVSAVAKKFGGGGHAQAAGFKTPRL